MGGPSTGRASHHRTDLVPQVAPWEAAFAACDLDARALGVQHGRWRGRPSDLLATGLLERLPEHARPSLPVALGRSSASGALSPSTRGVTDAAGDASPKRRRSVAHPRRRPRTAPQPGSTHHPWDDAVAECQRLDALNGRAVVPGEELGRIEVEGAPDVVLHEGLPALLYIPEACYPLPRREYFDEEASEELRATTLDNYYERAVAATPEEIDEQRRQLAERRKTWGQGR